ncbi:hypothetical protein BGW36DRAFT_423507 [Talaromyces proteolyticus]|uniref:Uncharacterized protein n=1 Tax=Talaromyces proteolyticus TaxID=1131652 RepID=A0AAD4L0H7_9EURO|nr:uncharacterized protein BGW36DRAFT_423507 [Talaromyces proteolyticus]KAH8703973.1 hypothetical protein BGW36DRAFT_423507 [Talaromyces proteolyticus]
MAALTFLLQIWTLCYSLLNVFRGMWEDRITASCNHHNDNHINNDVLSPQSSIDYWQQQHGGRRQSLATHKLLTSMQWRPMLASFGVLLHVVLFAAIFLILRQDHGYPASKYDDWVSCLLSSGDKNHCIEYASDLGPNEKLVVASFFMLAVSGFWGILIVTRFSMFDGWLEVLNCRHRTPSRSSMVATGPHDEFPLHRASTNDGCDASFNTTSSLPSANMK